MLRIEETDSSASLSTYVRHLFGNKAGISPSMISANANAINNVSLMILPLYVFCRPRTLQIFILKTKRIDSANC
ncbi:MAG: hypothetical protein ACI9LM_001472 [Alteromonadaceae bacterium]|jgi:hypothetical protein